MDEDKRTTASDVLFGNVFQISEDMVQGAYRLVEDLSKFENVFANMTKKLGILNANLNKYVVKKQWIKPQDKKRCQGKIDQSKELMAICTKYSKSCQLMSNNMIATMEQFESNKKARNIIKNLVDKIKDEADRIKENGPTGDNEDKA